MAATAKTLLAQIRKVAGELDRVPTLRAKRLDLFRQGHALGLRNREMAEAAGVSETAVIKALSRADERGT